jgi:hypothetical protein
MGGRGDGKEHDVGVEEKRMGGQTIVIDRGQQKRDLGRRKCNREMREGEFQGYICCAQQTGMHIGCEQAMATTTGPGEGGGLRATPGVRERRRRRRRRRRRKRSLLSWPSWAV